MNKIMNAYTGMCKNCHKHGRITSVDQNDNEISVCYNCGEVMSRQLFDARAFLKDLLEQDITQREALADQLTEQLLEAYGWMEIVDIESLANLLVGNLYDELKFETEAEAEENTDYIREREAARIGAW